MQRTDEMCKPSYTQHSTADSNRGFGNEKDIRNDGALNIDKDQIKTLGLIY